MTLALLMLGHGGFAVRLVPGEPNQINIKLEN